MPARSQHAEHEGLLAQAVAPRLRLLLDQSRPHQRHQQAPRRRLVQPAAGYDLAERQALGRLPPDQREQTERAVDTLRAGQSGAQRGTLVRQALLPTVHNMDLVLIV